MVLFPMPIAPHSLPPNAALVAIILIITTRRGPRFVFHYPGVPEVSQPSNSWAFGSIGSDSDDSNDSSDDDDGDDDDDGTTTDDADDTASRAGSIGSNRDGSRQGSVSGKTGRFSTASATATSTRRTTARTLREELPDDEEDVDDEIEALDLAAAAAAAAAATDANAAGKEGKGGEDGAGATGKDKVLEWEKVLGYPTEGLEKLLSPPEKFKKKKFEVSLEDLVFLGYPIFAKDGAWKKKKKERKKKGKHDDKEHNDDDADVNVNEGADPLLKEMNPFASLPRDEQPDLEAQNTSDAQMPDTESPALSPTATRDDATRAHLNIVVSPPDTNPISESFVSTGGMSEATSDAKSGSTASAGQNGDSMSMFHLVFVMNPPTLEYHIRVQEMYDHVVKKFSKALKYEQARSGWVEAEAKKILQMKMQAKESKRPPPMSVLWAKIIQHSPLAKAMANLYTSIANNKIAHINVGSAFDASIQIPQAISTSYVPTPMEPQLPGLWLTTAQMLKDDDGVATLSPHAALLLLEDKDTILKEVESDSKDISSPLAYFIRELNPTKSLKKLSASISLPLPDMQFLARHLIYWRRARAVPPLHIRDTYIVSPNCDLKQLSRATTLYAQQFAALPSLPNMLQLLSSKPRQYGYLIPSKEHKAPYMDILAWLLRGGWVTQLRTFAWVRVTPAVKAAVAVQLRKDAEEKNMAKAKAMSKPEHPGLSKSGALLGTAPRAARRTYSEDDYVSSASTSRKSSRSKAASPRLQPLLSPTRHRDRSVSDTGSIASTRTAIAIHSSSAAPSPALIPLRPSPLHTVDNINPLSPPNGVLNPSLFNTISASVPEHSVAETDTLSSASVPLDPLDTTSTDTGGDGGGSGAPETILSSGSTTMLTLPSTEEADYDTSLILSPHKANTLESKWLAHIGAHLVDQELREVWSTLIKYFDGNRAVEEIASREGWKRRRVDELMGRLELEGVLWVVRHW